MADFKNIRRQRTLGAPPPLEEASLESGRAGSGAVQPPEYQRRPEEARGPQQARPAPPTDVACAAAAARCNSPPASALNSTQSSAA